MLRKPYNEISCVEELYEQYGDMINESKKCKGKGKGKEKENEAEEGDPGKKGDGDDPEKVLETDNLPVVYADTNPKELRCIFEHIIVFTNDRSDDNKTLKHIREAIKHTDNKPDLHVFVAARMDADEDESKIYITDGTEEFTIQKENNLNTLVFSRLGVQGEDECEHVVKLLQDRGFLVLNPVRQSQLACDKYESACLFEKGDIPQPRFCYMDKETLYDKDKYTEQMRRVYPDWDPDNGDKNENFKLVIKILDGHGGTGVFTCSGDKMYAILQCIFAIDPERGLIIQKKEEADGGDIRVHVLTLRTKQVILAAMKRVKIGGDFRSNVSLGAEAEPVKLTPEQEQIALRTAALSKLPWCAVDIMPLVKGSNKEIGDNVVLEINASPGTDGISNVIGFNFVNVMLNELDDPSEFMLQDKTAGFIESCELDFGNGHKKEFLAKLDTGNSTSANTLEVGEYKEINGNIEFKIDGKLVKFKSGKPIHARAGEQTYTRPTITIPELALGLRHIKNVPIAIVRSRAEKTTNLLLCRDTLSKLGYVVSPGTAHILTKEIEKVKII